jgi:outer membrane lipoprotein carrier protein
MKTLVIAITAGLFSLNTFNSSAQEQVDKKAKLILDELSAKTKSYSTIKADFSFSVINKENKNTDTQNGSLFLKGDKYKLEIKGQEITSDGKTVWTYLKDANEVQLNNVDPNVADALNPSTIFTMYEKGFKYKFDKEEVINGATIQTILLYPLNPDKKKFHTVKLMIDKAKKQITAMKVSMKDGNTYSYVIKNFTPNTEIKDNIFVFDKKAHPGVEEVDLRD